MSRPSQLSTINFRIRALKKVEDTVRLTTTKNWLYWVFHQDDLAGAFGGAHSQIDDAFRIFQVSSEVSHPFP